MGLFMDALNALQSKGQELKELYEEGLSLSEKDLLFRCKYSSRTKRVAYMRALQDRYTQEEIMEFRRQGRL